jgi:predicted nuclease of predicted toxin-antitoxin system
VKFVFDHQLPPALARFLEIQGHEACHVREVGLAKTDDSAIWRYAADNGLGQDRKLSHLISAGAFSQ